MKSKKCGRGSVFFVGDFISYGNRDAVNKALERLVEKGQMLRVALCPIPVRTDSTDTDEHSLLNRWRLTYYKSWRREKHKIQARLSQIFLHP